MKYRSTKGQFFIIGTIIILVSIVFIARDFVNKKNYLGESNVNDLTYMSIYMKEIESDAKDIIDRNYGNKDQSVKELSKLAELYKKVLSSKNINTNLAFYIDYNKTTEPIIMNVEMQKGRILIYKNITIN